MNCIHFRGAVFVHVGPAEVCTENGVSIYLCSAVEVAWLAQIFDIAVAYTCVIASTVAFRCH